MLKGDAMLAKVAAYLAFLVVFGAWQYGTLRILNLVFRASVDERKVRSFLLLQAATLLAWLGAFTEIWILSGYWDLRLAALFVLGSEAAILIGMTLTALSGGQPTKTSALSVGMQLGVGDGAMMSRLLYQLLPGLITLSYLVVCGILVFSRDRSELPEPVLQFTLLFIFLVPIGLHLMRMRMIASPYLDRETRESTIVGEISGLVPNLLFLAILLASLNVADPGVQILDSTPISISLWTVLTLTLLFISRTLLPYLIGTAKARQYHEACIAERQALFSRTAEILERPTADAYADKLSDVQGTARQEFERLVERHPLLVLTEEDGDATDDPFERAPTTTLDRDIIAAMVNSNPAFKGMENYFERSWAQAQEVDPRFGQLTWLREFANSLEEAKTNLVSRPDRREREEAAAGWGMAFQKRKDDLRPEEHVQGKSRAPAISALFTLTGLVSSTFIDQFGGWLWDSFSHSFMLS